MEEAAADQGLKSNATPTRLRDALLVELVKRVEEGEKVLLKNGTVDTISAPASTLNVAVAYLKQFPPDDSPVPLGRAAELQGYVDKLKKFTAK